MNKLLDSNARDYIDWLHSDGYKFPVIAIVENLSPMELIEVLDDSGAVSIIQRPVIDKQLVETGDKYAKAEHVVLTLDNHLMPCLSEALKNIIWYKKLYPTVTYYGNYLGTNKCGTRYISLINTHK